MDLSLSGRHIAALVTSAAATILATAALVVPGAADAANLRYGLFFAEDMTVQAGQGKLVADPQATRRGTALRIWSDGSVRPRARYITPISTAIEKDGISAFQARGHACNGEAPKVRILRDGVPVADAARGRTVFTVGREYAFVGSQMGISFDYTKEHRYEIELVNPFKSATCTRSVNIERGWWNASAG